MRRLLLMLLASFIMSSVSWAQYPDRFTHYRSVPSSNEFWLNALSSYGDEKFTEALESASAAEKQFLSNDDWESLLFINNFKAQLLGEIGKPKEALTNLSRARELAKKHIDTLTSVEYIENLFLTGRIYTLTNDYTLSESLFLRTAQALEQSGKYPEVHSLVLFTLWQLYTKQSKSNQAHWAIEKAVKRIEKNPSDYAIALLLHIQAERLNVAQLHLKAELFMASTKAFERANSTTDYLYFTNLMKLSQQFSSFQSDYQKATRYTMLAEEYATKNKLSKAKKYRLYFAIGDMYRSFKIYSTALPYFEKGLQTTLEVFGASSLEFMLANLYLGRLYHYMGSYELSSQYLYRAYSIGKTGWKGKFPNEFTLYGQLGRLYSTWEKPDSALRYAQKRLVYEHSTDTFGIHHIPPVPRRSNTIRYYNSLIVKIEAYKQLYQQSNDTTLLTIALNHCNYSIDILKSLNEKAMEEQSGLRNSARMKTVASYAIYFTLEKWRFNQSDALLKQALMFSEAANANYLNYLFDARYNGAAKSNSPIETLKDSIRIVSIEQQNASDAGADSLYRRVLNLKMKLVNLILNEAPKKEAPLTGNVKGSVKPLNSIDSLQQSIPSNTAILTFFIDSFEQVDDDPLFDNKAGKQRLIAFYLDNESIKHRITTLTPNHEETIRNYMQNLKTGNLKGYIDIGTKLYALFMEPFAPNLILKKHMVLIPDATLADIPFESFPINTSGEPLCNRISTSYHYSVGLWSGTSSASNSKHKSFAAFAPSFTNTSGSISLTSANLTSDSLVAYNSSIFRNEGQLVELPMAKEEVLQIGKLFGKKKHRNIKVLLDRVSKEDFVRDATNFDILHIATHGFLDKSDFRNSGIFFSSSKTMPSSEAEILHLNEIYNLNTKANLVVLSACKTSVGRKVTGEGVMALPRGFIYAGVPNVIASLWKVHDEKTKELMVDFYGFVLNGHSYPEALRLAKISSINKGVLPLDWAGFVLIGK